MGVYEDNIIPIKISRLAEYVSRKKRISLDEALTYIYSNDMYKELYNEGAKWWYLSSEALYEEFENKRKAHTQVVSEEAFEFFVYTLEKYAISKGIGGGRHWLCLRSMGPMSYSERTSREVDRNKTGSGKDR